MQPHVVVLTGAGASADSGVRTFRDAGGTWEGHDVLQVATPEGWRRDRRLVWSFYQARRAQLREVEPNAAHVALVRLERELEAAGHGFTLVSQNVDDLHRRAGSTVIEMHGNLARLRCERCGATVEDRDHVDPEVFVPCDACGHDALRPDVVWFGELPFGLDEIERALRRCTHFAAIGTSGQVYPAAGLLEAARAGGARTWVNALEAPANLHPDDRFLPGRAGEVVPGWVDGLLADLAGR